MEASCFSLTINFDLVEKEVFHVEFFSYSDTVSYLVRKILQYYDSKPIFSFYLVPIKEIHDKYSLMNPSNIDLFNYLIH